MKKFLIGLLTFWIFMVYFVDTGDAKEYSYLYQGNWQTTNRPLNGEMTCLVTYKGDDKWVGHFYGVWQGVSFDYNEVFSGRPDKLLGTANIDGANYDWKGIITKEEFKVNFGGDRYQGSFKLARKYK